MVFYGIPKSVCEKWTYNLYSSALNWNKVNAMVTLHVPDMHTVETQLNETSSNKGFSAVAELKKENNLVVIERLNRFLKGYTDCDKA